MSTQYTETVSEIGGWRPPLALHQLTLKLSRGNHRHFGEKNARGLKKSLATTE